MNRFQLNFKRNVGAVSEEIRQCQPKNLNDWKNYYFKNVRTSDYIEELGRKLYVKITEVIAAEVEDITEEDCISYMYQMVIDRTYDGYTTEIKTIYGQLQKNLGVRIEPAPDKWDRIYNVDFFIKINKKYIGLQIKPVSGVAHISQIYKERRIQKETHEKFKKQLNELGVGDISKDLRNKIKKKYKKYKKTKKEYKKAKKEYKKARKEYLKKKGKAPKRRKEYQRKRSQYRKKKAEYKKQKEKKKDELVTKIRVT